MAGIAELEAEEKRSAAAKNDADAALAIEQKKQLEKHRWWHSLTVPAIAGIAVPIFLTLTTIKCAKNDLQDLQEKVKIAEQRAADLQVGLNRRSAESVIREHWLAHAVDRLALKVPNLEDQYKTYAHNFFLVVSKQYDGIPLDLRNWVERELQLVIHPE
jgi:hypothetical protein